MPRPKLTPKQIKFIALYDGNGAKAAKAAGYRGSPNTLKQVAAENLTKPYIAAEIKKRQDAELKPLIADRQKRQQFWTEVMHDKSRKMSDRLRASELLGKSEADFTEQVKLSGSSENPVKVNITLPDNGFSAAPEKDGD